MRVISLGLAYAVILPAWNGLVATVVPDEHRGVMVGFVMTIEGLGIAVGPTFSGILASVFGSKIWAFYGA